MHRGREDTNISSDGLAGPTHFDPWFSVCPPMSWTVPCSSRSAANSNLASGSVLSDAVANQDGGLRRLVLDLSDLDFIGVAGFRVLISCANGDVTVSIRNPSDAAPAPHCPDGEG